MAVSLAPDLAEVAAIRKTFGRRGHSRSLFGDLHRVFSSDSFPGFAYLGGLACAGWATPRLQTPRASRVSGRVAFAIGGKSNWRLSNRDNPVAGVSSARRR